METHKSHGDRDAETRSSKIIKHGCLDVYAAVAGIRQDQELLDQLRADVVEILLSES